VYVEDTTMQTYRLKVGPDGQVTVPNARPGQTVTVQVETVPESRSLTLATAKTPEERAQVIAEIKAMTSELRELWKDAPPFAVEDLYGEDGLPR
jgi:hypothetical protein